jgi:hypothetical protein
MPTTPPTEPPAESPIDRPTDRRAAMATAAALGLGGLAAAAFAQPRPAGSDPTRLVVLWTSADPDVAHRVGLMYTHAARKAGWFEEVHLIVWGPSQRTLVGDKDLRAKVLQMARDGVTLQACVVCADSYGIADELRALGCEVKPMGQPLSEFILNPAVNVLTV